MLATPWVAWVSVDGRGVFAYEFVGHPIDDLAIIALPGIAIGFSSFWRRIRYFEMLWFLGAVSCALYVAYCYICYAFLDSPVPSDGSPAIGLILGVIGAGMQLSGALLTFEPRKLPPPKVVKD